MVSVGYVGVLGTILGVLSAEKKRQKRIIQMREKGKTYTTGKNMGYKKTVCQGGVFLGARRVQKSGLSISFF